MMPKKQGIGKVRKVALFGCGFVIIGITAILLTEAIPSYEGIGG